MADNKTQMTGVSADDFIAALEHPVRRQDGMRLRTLMAELTGQEPEMWGPTCLYINKLADVDEAVLAELISIGYRHGTRVLHGR
jgi:hypothetical protein